MLASRHVRAALAIALAVLQNDSALRGAHLGTYADVDAEARAAQLRAIADDAEGHPHVIIGGDMNDPNVGRIMGRL